MGGGDSLDRSINLIKYLVEQGKNIIVVGPVPYFSFSVPDHWIYQQIKTGLPIDFLTDPIVNQETLFNVQLVAQQKLSESLTSRHVSWIDPLSRFCNRGRRMPTFCVVVRCWLSNTDTARRSNHSSSSVGVGFVHF